MAFAHIDQTAAQNDPLYMLTQHLIITAVRSGMIFLRADFKLITFAAYNSDLDIGFKFQFFPKF